MKQWLKETGLKTIKTMAQSALAVITLSTIVTEVDWITALGASALSGVVCVLTNIGSLKLSESESEAK